MRILRYLKKSWLMILGILLLLVVQAFCDLALPSYTSDIVDVGIMQDGITDAVPDKIRPESLQVLELFMSEDEAQLVADSYVLDEDGNYKVQIDTEEQREAVSDAFGIPMLIVAQASNEQLDVDQLQAGLEAGAVTKEQLLQIREQAVEQLGSMGDTAITQNAVSYIRTEYEALDIDVGQIQQNYMIHTGGKMLGLTLLSAVAAVIVCMMASYIAAGISRDLRKKTYARTLSFSNTEINKFTAASLITRNTNDIQQVQMALVILLRIVLYAPILGIGGVLRVVGTQTGMGWIVAVAVGLILLLVSCLMGFTMPKFKILQTLVDKLNLVSREILTGLPVIRAFGQEQQEEKRFDDASRDLMKTQLFTNRAMSLIMPVMMLIMNVITILIVWFGAKGIDLGNLQLGDMMAFITYTMQIVMAFMMLSVVSIILPRANVAAARIDEVCETVPSITDVEQPEGEDKTDWRGRIRFEDVSFRFPGAEEDVLRHITFTAEPGKTTAIIGSTGSGKSTLINLLPRLYDVTSGSISLDGVNISKMSQNKLHSLMGVVPQKGILFSGDIASNIRFGNNEITDEEIAKAAEIAQAADFVAEKEGGYHSPISQGGTNVSGGQKQRLSIARAIAKRPPVFIFDDSFSALDYKTDTLLRRAMKENLSESTILIVAQRISTILTADQIIVLNQGEIVGIGTHAELMESCEPYQEIARSQLSSQELGIKEVVNHG
ncbi:MAG: ABC transporter ATP-binding protein [Lachnospiraceae bacterium]